MAHDMEHFSMHHGRGRDTCPPPASAPLRFDGRKPFVLLLLLLPLLLLLLVSLRPPRGPLSHRIHGNLLARLHSPPEPAVRASEKAIAVIADRPAPGSGDT